MTQMSCFFRCHVEQSETSLDVTLPPCYKTCSGILNSVQNDKLTRFIREISVIRGS